MIVAHLASHILGMLDPKSGKVVEYPMPITKPGRRWAGWIWVRQTGQHLDGDDVQGSLARFDLRTKTFQTWGSPTFQDREKPA